MSKEIANKNQYNKALIRKNILKVRKMVRTLTALEAEELVSLNYQMAIYNNCKK